MSKDILGSLVRVLVTVPMNRLGLIMDIAHKLSGDDGDEWRRQGALFLRKEPCWTNGQVTQVTEPKTTPSILKFVSMVKVAATINEFVAKEKFVRKTGPNAKIKISCLGNNFTSWFLNGDSKIEGPINEQTLSYHKLRQSSADGPIIAELGGAEKSEMTLSEMFSLMEKQGNGEDGVLLNNGYASIFHIKDSIGVLRAVLVRWHDGGWCVHAYSVEDPRRWIDGNQVFSRNSVLRSLGPLATAA